MPNESLDSVDRWQIFANSIVDYAFILLDPENHVVDWNPGAEQMLGYTRQEIFGRSGDLFFTPEDRRAGVPGEEIEKALKEGRAEEERWQVRKDGTRFRASGVLTCLQDELSNVIGFAKVLRDVTAREQMREQLERSLRERTALLGEIHHRVKNNLQMILSLIRLQADRITDPPSLTAFEETEARVRTIAAVHERLYATPDLGTVHVEPYLRTLVRDVRDNCNEAASVDVEMEVADLALEISSAVPLALITNELLCNAFKHAFPEGRRGSVALKVSYQDGGHGEFHAQLEICDNGVGLPSAVRFETADSMGFDLVRILARQLRAQIAVETSASGTCFRIAFPLKVD